MFQCRYEDDLDHGEYFLYTGSGGRDLSGNKRTSKASLLSSAACSKPACTIANGSSAACVALGLSAAGTAMPPAAAGWLCLHSVTPLPSPCVLPRLRASPNLLLSNLCPQVQSFDQKFDLMNKALLLSCQKGLPVRVVRSHKVRSVHLMLITD